MIKKHLKVWKNYVKTSFNRLGTTTKYLLALIAVTLNRYIGSSDTSQHVLGQAVDLEIPGVNNEELFNFIKDELDFDQVILEYYDGVDPSSGWVHVSYVSNKDNRNRAMTFDGDHYRIVEE